MHNPGNTERGGEKAKQVKKLRAYSEIAVLEQYRHNQFLHPKAIFSGPLQITGTLQSSLTSACALLEHIQGQNPEPK